MSSLSISAVSVNASTASPCYHIHTTGLDAGEYLVTATPGVPGHVVTLYQDATGARHAACTCTLRTIWRSADYQCCPHAMAVWCFVQIHPSRIQERLDSLQRGAERMMRVHTPPAAMDARIAEIVTAIGTLRQRKAATVRLVESVGASAPTPWPVLYCEAQDAYLFADESAVA
jgi:hypothetical protein